MALITTPRTTLRDLATSDAAFIASLLNEPSFLRYIGDRGVRSADDAGTFIETRYRQSYRDHGYGLYLLSDRASSAPIGICGLVRREGLEHPDLGFAVVPAAEGRGLVFEAANAVLAYAWTTLRLPTLLAVVQPDNVRSTRLLERLGFVRDGAVVLPPSEATLDRYRLDAPPGSARH